MSQALKEIALLEDVSSLPSSMQNFYIQLVSAIDCSLQKLREFGAHPDHISEEFIETLVNRLINQELTQQDLESCVEEEFQRRILVSATFTTVC
ncbi:MAG: hypothetical protein ACJA2Q_002013 [Pseudohongiellaceae bacterium]|jgi:hypothetical protein